MGRINVTVAIFAGASAPNKKNIQAGLQSGAPQEQATRPKCSTLQEQAAGSLPSTSQVSFTTLHKMTARTSGGEIQG